MLRQNSLQPPRPFFPPSSAGYQPAVRASDIFISAEDFDRTGILAGLDPCESRYWWLPELYGPEPAAGRTTASQATSLPARPATEAA
jgi:hypothetical protein